MTGRLLAERLAAAGLDPLDAPAKAKLYDTVLSAFHEATGTIPEHACWVPGRLEVFGTHTDYAGGRTLVSALPRGLAFAGSRRPDGQLRAIDAATGESVLVAALRRRHPNTGAALGAPALAGGAGASGWRHLVDVVVGRLGRNFPGASLAADIVFASDLPRAAGMSSSSALMVGVATTIVRLSGIRERAEWRTNITGPLDEAGYYACIENGRTFGELAGDAGVGTHGGSEDHAAIVCGTPEALSAFAFEPMRRVASVRVPAAWRIVVASSGVAADKTGGALESYNRLARGAAILLDLWNQSEAAAVSLASALASDPSARRRLLARVAATRIEGWPAEALEARLQHFVREDARVPEAVRAFEDRDAAAMAALAASSQADSERLLRNQVNETVALTRMAVECGAFAARSFGAGFGGSVWAIVDREGAAAFVPRWTDAYRGMFPHARAAVFVAQPAPAVAEVRTSGVAGIKNVGSPSPDVG